MPDRGKKFHEFALKSVLFKGRNDWYYCYLKAEKIAHVLAILGLNTTQGHEGEELLHATAALPQAIAHLAAGELEPAFVLADIFGLLSATRLAVTQRVLSAEQGSLLVREYEGLAERLLQGSHPSPFLSAEDFFVPDLPTRDFSLPATIKDIKDTSVMSFINKGQTSRESSRSSSILDCIRDKKSASIKEIAAIVRDCSEKTIQRELAVLIEKGLVRRVGERRWSVYTPA